MTNPVGNELVQVIGVTPTGQPAGVSEYFTTQQIANLGGGGGSSNITPTRLISSGSSDTATNTDGSIGWNSASASAKTESIPAPTQLGQNITIKDAYGNAGTYSITVTPVSGTIDGQANYVLDQNYEAITLVANGSTNWMIL